jgi:hypothetical protein
VFRPRSRSGNSRPGYRRVRARLTVLGPSPFNHTISRKTMYIQPAGLVVSPGLPRNRAVHPVPSGHSVRRRRSRCRVSGRPGCRRSKARPSAARREPAASARCAGRRAARGGVLRLLRGESLDALARDLRQPAGRIAAWREEFLAAGREGLKAGAGGGPPAERGAAQRSASCRWRSTSCGRSTKR